MLKKFLILLLLVLCFSSVAFADEETDEWSKHLDVYNSDGLDRPVSAIEYQKTMKELQELKDKKKKKKRWFQKEEEMPDEPVGKNEPIEVERTDILKVTTPLYYDGSILPVGFYKITAEEITGEYFINFVQGKSTILKVKANKISHMDFCGDKVNCMETEIYQDKYFKINFKTIDHALSAYLAIVNL